MDSLDFDPSLDAFNQAKDGLGRIVHLDVLATLATTPEEKAVVTALGHSKYMPYAQFVTAIENLRAEGTYDANAIAAVKNAAVEYVFSPMVESAWMQAKKRQENGVPVPIELATELGRGRLTQIFGRKADELAITPVVPNVGPDTSGHEHVFREFDALMRQRHGQAPKGTPVDGTPV